MDELSIQEHWFSAADGFGILEPEPEIYICNPQHDQGAYHQVYEEEMENLTANIVENTISCIESDNSPSRDANGSEKAWSINPCCSVKYRLTQAIGYFKQYVEDLDVLIQIWIPVNRGGLVVLTTDDQPYSISSHNEGLASFRNVSRSYNFPAELNSMELAGLPGRVFLGKFPEWSPDVRFFKSDECPRINYAKMYSIGGCLALPVFEHGGGGTCLAVIEIVTTTQKISYRSELENIYKSLEAVDLVSSHEFYPGGIRAWDELYHQYAVFEIAEVLEHVCTSLKLPLALTWASYMPRNETGLDLRDEKSPCISTVNSACFLTDEDFLGFYVACTEQYLSPEQGIVGKAFSRGRQCFAKDITSFSKANYPLTHHAKMFNLHAAVAIPLQNIHSGSIDFVLEFFLPNDCQDIEEHKQMLDALSSVMNMACQNFHVIMDKEFEEEVSRQTMAASDARHRGSVNQREESSWISLAIDHQMEDDSACIDLECPKEEPEELFQLTTRRDHDDEMVLYHNQSFSEFCEVQLDFESKNNVRAGEEYCISRHYSLGIRKPGRKKTKKEKTISLQVLRQYFAVSLKDAAKSIGVCPTTLKRICRQHGITRWPSRKIKKVGHSLKKLQLVVDSVHGAKGLIQIGSIQTTFPGLLHSSKISEDGLCSSFKMANTAKENTEADTNPDSTDSKSQSSSCGQNHGSGLSYSETIKPKPMTATASGLIAPVEDPVAVLKRTYREAEVQYSDGHNSQDGIAFRIKATFGEKNIRMSMQPNWHFRDLQQEIGKRFNINNFNSIDLKYLDNDQDTVLLTCDADLEECKQLFQDSMSQTIRISLHQAISSL